MSCLPKTKLPELNEVVFDPSRLAAEDEYQQEKLVVIRRKLFEALVDGTNLETSVKVAERIGRLGAILKEARVETQVDTQSKNQVEGQRRARAKTSAETVLVITHGFLMRYLDIAYRQKSQDFGLQALNQAVNYDYVSGFTVVVE